MAAMTMRTDGPIRTRVEGGVLEVTLDRPKANAIDLAAHTDTSVFIVR